MTRRKYVLHEYPTDRGRTPVNQTNIPSKPKDTSLAARAKVSQIILFMSIVSRFSI
jgi:hypothetical protein